MEYMYNTEHTCSKQIKVNLEGDIIEKVEFLGGGCDGNLKAIPMIVKGMTVDEVEAKLSGITCGRKPTSCGDQLARAVREAYNHSQN